MTNMTVTGLPELKLQEYTLRMPQWNACGLDERWLLQECGARHWDLLGEACGVPPDSFADHSGHPVYASFVEIHLSGSLFIEYKEQKRITVHSYLEIFGRGRSMSFHQVDLGDGAGVTVQMKAVFVRRRMGTGKNRFVKELPRQLPRRFQFPSAGWTSGLQAIVPAAEPGNEIGADLRSYVSAAEAEFLPCPALDFNGIGLLYFARYQDFADRLEWMWLTEHGIRRLFTTTNRTIYLLRNLDMGDSISALLLNPTLEDNVLTHTAILRRNADCKTIALIETRKQKAISGAS